MDEFLKFTQVVAPVLLAILAYFLGGVNERARDKRQLERETEAREHQRQMSAEAERHAFQQATFLDLQDAVIEAARMTVRTIMEDRRLIKLHGTFTMLGEEFGGEASMTTMRNLHRLRNRVLDDGLREALEKYGSACTAATLPPLNWKDLSKEDALALVERRHLEFAPEVQRVEDLLGVLLRKELAREV